MPDKQTVSNDAVNPLERRDRDHATLEAKLRLEDHQRQIDEIKETAKTAFSRATELQERIDGVIGWQKRQNGDIASSITAINNLSINLGERIEKGRRDNAQATEEVKALINRMHDEHDVDLENVCKDYDEQIKKVHDEVSANKLESHDSFDRMKTDLTAMFNKGLQELGAKFDAFQLSNKTWIIGILVSIVVSTVLIIVSRVATIPGGHI